MRFLRLVLVLFSFVLLVGCSADGANSVVGPTPINMGRIVPASITVQAGQIVQFRYETENPERVSWGMNRSLSQLDRVARVEGQFNEVLVVEVLGVFQPGATIRVFVEREGTTTVLAEASMVLN